MKATAQKGLWNGGYVSYGYGYDFSRQMLFPNDEEAATVRGIFEDSLRLQSVGKICEELSQAELRA